MSGEIGNDFKGIGEESVRSEIRNVRRCQEEMKVTGKELFDWWSCTPDRRWEAWDKLAEKLNGMNGEPIDACPLCHRRYEETGDDGPWAKVEITDKSWKVKLLAEEERPKPEWMKDYKREFDSGFDKLLREQLDASRARHHATCPYRHGKGDCTC